MNAECKWNRVVRTRNTLSLLINSPFITGKRLTLYAENDEAEEILAYIVESIPNRPVKPGEKPRSLGLYIDVNRARTASSRIVCSHSDLEEVRDEIVKLFRVVEV